MERRRGGGLFASDGTDNNHNHGGEKSGLDSHQTKKLERLRKELKIVRAESSKRASANEEARILLEKQRLASLSTVEGMKHVNEEKYSIVERYASVYFDRVMNPYGVPPPGMPRVYWDGNGGRTMKLSEAVIPERFRSLCGEDGQNDK